MLETSLGAISRLRAFETETPVEAKAGEDSEPPADWPSNGLIEIKDISVHYKYATISHFIYIL
jgi:ATP-binding cassette subfamily C (CFTR/MRP) protein 1